MSQPHGGVAAWSAVLLGGPKHFVLPNYKFRILMFQHISNLENVNFRCFVHRHRSIWSVPHVPPACSVVQTTHPVCEKSSEVSFRRFETSDFSCLSHSLKLSKMLDCVVHYPLHPTPIVPKLKTVPFSQTGRTFPGGNFFPI